jgi:exodeoxyribonuclease-1
MTFYFYDLETSGRSARDARVMQFAGQRTDIDLNPIGEPDNILIRLTPDVIPEPEAILITGITPQATVAGGITEAELTKYLTSQVFVKDTIAVGFNNIRFDNEFIRYTLWRNFYDAYEWSWKDGCSTWDLLDLVRMTRALRPEGIKWPFASDGRPSNKLEFLTKVNNLSHDNAHDALADVNAAIAMARLVKEKQPKLFDYSLNHRHKNKVAPLVEKGDPFVYVSGRYPSEFEKAAIAVMVVKHPKKQSALVYDLRIDPEEFANLSPAELHERWQAWGEDVPYFPVKELAYNKCPAIAPIQTVRDGDWQRLKLHKEMINNHLEKLKEFEDFGDKLVAALELREKSFQPELVPDEQKVDAQLYDGFINDQDKTKMGVVRAAAPDELGELHLDFSDERLKLMLPLYKARNYPEVLTPDEREHWEKFRANRLLDGGANSKLANFFQRLEAIATQPGLSPEKQYLLEELNLYGQSLLPDA